MEWRQCDRIEDLEPFVAFKPRFHFLFKHSGMFDRAKMININFCYNPFIFCIPFFSPLDALPLRSHSLCYHKTLPNYADHVNIKPSKKRRQEALWIQYHVLLIR